MKRISGILLIVLMILSMVLAACSAKPTPTPTKAPTPTPVPQATPTPPAKTLKIGVTQPLTGSAVTWGKTMRDTNILITEQVNNAGGLVIGGERYLIQAIYEDEKYTPEGGRAAAEKLIFQDKVRIILAHGGSPPASTMQPVAESNGVLLVAGAWDPTWLGAPNKYFFGTGYDGHMQASALMKQLSEKFKVKTVVQTCMRGPTETRQLKPSKEVETQFGITTVAEAIYETGIKDFTAILTPLLAKNPDAIIMNGTESDLALQIKQTRELGYKGIIANANPVGTKVMLDVVGKDAAQGVVSRPLYPVTEQAKKLKADFEAKFGYFDTLVLDPYLSTLYYSFLAGIKKADSTDPAKIAAAMEGLQVDTVFGKAQFAGKGKYGQSHLLYSPVQIHQFKGSDYELLGMLTVEDQIALLNSKWPPAY